MRLGLLLLGMLFLTGSSFQLYGSSSKVVKLTAANFRDQVINSKGIWLVEFFGRMGLIQLLGAVIARIWLQSGKRLHRLSRESLMSVLLTWLPTSKPDRPTISRAIQPSSFSELTRTPLSTTAEEELHLPSSSMLWIKQNKWLWEELEQLAARLEAVPALKIQVLDLLDQRLPLLWPAITSLEAFTTLNRFGSLSSMPHGVVIAR